MKLYDENEREKIQKARAEVERLAQERVQHGTNQTIAEARVAVYKARRDLTDILWDAPLPEPEPEVPVQKSAREKVEAEIMARAAVLADKDPSLTRAEAAMRALKQDRDLWEKYLNA